MSRWSDLVATTSSSWLFPWDLLRLGFDLHAWEHQPELREGLQSRRWELLVCLQATEWLTHQRGTCI